ncbi:MAG: glycyl-radical enzyme activating protein [Clostridia bacterium]|nr:glycyl-radical enzyme activating protein [Clostridia bacterium]
MSQPVGIVADIERSSTHDGPGMRTVVFLKGCPLHCVWCHNPECIDPRPQELFYPDKCIGCKRCAEGCYTGARVICGRKMTVADVMREVDADRGYYGREGGLTVSGGEPLMQREFTLALLREAKARGIGTAVETSMIYWDEEIFRACDLVMFDVKLPDDERHKRWTGVPFAPIRANILRLAGLGVPMLARTPVVPGVNADAATIGEIAAFLRDIPAVYKYELLSYHPLGVAKQRALGQPETQFEIPSKQLMEELKQYAFLR